MSKKVVHYSRLVFCQVGWGARVVPVDHTNHELGQHATNGELNTTSTVLFYDPSTGEFETKNSIYKPLI